MPARVPVNPGPSVDQGAPGVREAGNTQTEVTSGNRAKTETLVKVCGQDYTRKVKGGAEKVYQCKKETGHDGKHGPVRAKPVDTSDVPMAILDSFEAVPGTEIVPIREADAIRSPQQEKVDKQVKSAYDSWVIAGKPKAFNDSPRQRYRLNNVDEAKMVTIMLRKAARYHNLHVRIAPVSKHKDGGVMLVWVATDPRQREATEGS